MEQFRATILVVEDHRATRTFLTDNLAADGFEPVEAESAEEARELLRTQFPDLALIDLGLPDEDGLELLRAVRAADRVAGTLDPEMPLLVLTGRASELDQLRAFDRGCDDYLVKPFSYAELRARIRALLRRSNRRPRFGRIRVGTLEVDPLSRQVWLRGQLVILSKKGVRAAACARG
jgi:DNA-binding response OmpR family regulator